MITVKEIESFASKKYIDFVRSIINKNTFFPLDVRFRKPAPKEILSNYSKIDNWIRSIRDNSYDTKKYGYKIEFAEIQNRLAGKQMFPVRIYFDDELSYLRFIGKENEVRVFKNLVNYFCGYFDSLETILVSNIADIEYIDSIKGPLVEIVCYFKNNPNPGIYLRELPLTVDTKFIENNEQIIRQMLDAVLKNNINKEERLFEKRYGLKHNESLIRVNILDMLIADRCFSGINDLSIKISDFNRLKLPIEKVFIFENKTNYSNVYNFLTVPQSKNSIAIFGKGFGVGALKDAFWLKDKEIYYWGDIDPHGFMILSGFREHFPQTKSILMDSITFNSHYDRVVDGNIIQGKRLDYLTTEENALFQKLNVYPQKNRLEQEAIPHDYVVKYFSLNNI